MPGLVDIHVHAYPGVTPWGIDPGPVALRNGVTTVVDAGSAGASTFAGLRHRMEAEEIRTRCLLNVSTIGLAAEFGELLHEDLLDTAATVRIARAHPGRIVGLKIRVAPNTTGENWRLALRSAREAADEVELPIMVHVSEGPPDLATIAHFLRAGDIVTHCFTPYGNGLVSADLRVNPWAEDLFAAGVLFDVGHGRGSFSFPHAEMAIAHGLVPHFISTDLHAHCVHGPAFGMTTVMSKMLAAGMPLEAVWPAATTAPAGVARVPSGVTPGARADLALFSLEEGRFEYWDSRGETRMASRRIACAATVLDGEVAFVDPSIRAVVARDG